jgi:hypothetical protein
MLNKQLQYINSEKEAILEAFNALDEALAILQHHDAVAGTEKQHVNDDYIQTLSQSL